MKIVSTRSSHNWNTDTGNLDCLNTEIVFSSSNKFGIPDLEKNFFIPDDLIMYGTEVRRSYAQTKGKTVHFFLDDYKFEPLWNKPIKTSSPIITLGRALTPDFSLFADYPLALQLYNVYRSRWLGRFWQQQGVQVIPTISWGGKDSFEFCFEGVSSNSIVAIGTVGVRKENRKVFQEGFEKMLEELNPSDIIIYGENEPVDFKKYLAEEHLHKYESYWKKRRSDVNGRSRKPIP